MRRTTTTIWAFLLVWGLGTSVPGWGQVPSHQERIRETAKEILARPEFGLFPRLKTGEPASPFSRTLPGKGVPRFKSSTGNGPEAAGGGQERIGGQPGQGRQAPHRGQGRMGQGGANRLPENPPGGNVPPGKGHLENPQDALGRDEIFPDAKNLDRLLENQNLDINPGEQQPGQNNRNEANAQGNENARIEGQEPLLPNQNGPNRNRQGRGGENAGQRRQGNEAAANPPRNRDALPAPRPRETTGEESATPSFRAPEVGAFARMVGAIFHVMAWTILAVICGLILWLIVKAILEFERPAAFAPLKGDGGSALDLEPAQAPGDLPADVYVRNALQLAEQGLYREAVVQLLMGAMSRVERAGWVRFRRGMTVRDYLRGINQHRAAYQGMRSIIRVFEPLTFGRREPTQEHFERSLQGYEAGFGLE